MNPALWTPRNAQNWMNLMRVLLIILWFNLVLTDKLHTMPI